MIFFIVNFKLTLLGILNFFKGRGGGVGVG